ncbi:MULTISPECIES: DNA polymerase III subunit chi [Kordiimonas]|jgi:DNA polymerase-3 subunit chi|uniref:DNA polymerase III subunit chi n=1 Tax=Kordiimonas TaxID=288021 RepID=UPI00257EC517|nr:DNA polymerase III subunit chi [Kordiimonas sp. UBA4487]
MAEIRFYHLQRQTLEQALPQLMAKVYETGQNAVVKLPGKGLMETVDKVLWDFDPASFIPHDKEGCQDPSEQPIYLTTGDDNPNGAKILVLIDAVKCPDMGAYDRCLYMFDGRDEGIVAEARADWKAFKEMGVEMSYWQQREQGGWEQKA